ncbi:MAG TPA: hypothetical protein VN663_22725 [Ramlibacter sp.]|nr:hypothetical protein [Ramlibacter sp.]
MSAARWLANARAAHTRALGSTQAFPLFGDGDHVAGILTGQVERDPDVAGAALAEARYRDWQHARMTGAADTSAFGTAGAYTSPPPLALTPDDVPAVQTRLTLPSRQRTRTPLDDAAAIIKGLVDEFGDLFPDECAAAVAWLARQ